MWRYEFSLTRILPYKDRIVDSVIIRKNTGQWKSVFSHILCTVSFSFKLFHATDLFLYHLKTSENQRFSYVYWVYKERPVAWNVLQNFIALLLQWLHHSLKTLHFVWNIFYKCVRKLSIFLLQSSLWLILN